MFISSKTIKNRHPKNLLQTHLALEELEPRTLPSAYSPLQIATAYGINQISLASGAVNSSNLGAGETIAIVDAYYDPSIKADLTAFSQKYGLAPLNGLNGNGTFTQVDLSNKTLSPAGDDWTIETALDVEWAHAVAPKANIVLVEALSDNQDPNTGEPTDLLNAVHYAATTAGAQVVSMSWGINEVPGETSWDSFFTTPGVTFVAASGDSGAGTIWPAVSPNVVSVGGTTLNLSKTNTISSETGWGYGNWSFYFGGSGGGFSQYEPLPSYQANAGISTTYTQFNARLNPDVAYDANPNTGFYVLDGADGGWFVVGGTSAGAPQWSALIAIADQGRALDNLPSLNSSQTLSTLYANKSDFHDITRGSTGFYYVTDSNGNIIGEIPVKAGPGYDLVTGLGSPIANKIVPALAGLPTTTTAIHLTTITSASGGSSGKGSGKSSHFASMADPNPVSSPSTPVVIAIIQLELLQLQASGPTTNSGSTISPPVAVAPVVVVPQAPIAKPALSVNPAATGVPVAPDASLETYRNSYGPLLPPAPIHLPAPQPHVPAPEMSRPELFLPEAKNNLPESLDIASEILPPWNEAPPVVVETTAVVGLSTILVGMGFSPVLTGRESPKELKRKRLRL